MKNNHSYIQRMAAWAMALPACVALVLTGCTNEQITDAVEAPQTRTVTFTAVAPEGAGSRALWESEPAASGKLGFAWEPETDNEIDLFWVGATSNRLQKDAALSDHLGAEVTITGTVPEGATEVVALFPANTIQVGDGEMYRTLPTALTQKGSTTDHLRGYMYMNGIIDASEVTDGTGVMQLTHGCAVLRFNVKNGGASNVRVTKVEMFAASGKTGVNTRAAITSESANNGGALIYSNPENIAIHVQDASNATKGHLLAAKSGETIESLSVYAHCFPTPIEDGQFLFLVTVTDADGENEKTYITKEPFSVSGITTTDNTQKMFKAGYYYTFNLDIAGSRFVELKDYVEVKDEGNNVTGYIVNTYAGLWAWREAVMNVDGTMKDDDLNLTLAKDIIMSEVGEGGINWIPVGWDYVNSAYQKYKGNIDGAGHTISGLVIISDDLGGFVGALGEGGCVKNLTFENAVIQGIGASVFVGDNCGTVENCSVVSGSVSGSDIAGGIVQNNYGTVENCSVVSGSVSGPDIAGGIVQNNCGILSGCYNGAAVSCSSNGVTGGIAASNEGTIMGCINSGTIQNSELGNPHYCGGIVGAQSGSSNAVCIACGNLGEVSSSGITDCTGGIVGYIIEGKAIALWTKATMESDDSGDGIGDSYYSEKITSCHSFADVSVVTTDLVATMNAAIEAYNNSATEDKKCPYTWQWTSGSWPTLVMNK